MGGKDKVKKSEVGVLIQKSALNILNKTAETQIGIFYTWTTDHQSENSRGGVQFPTGGKSESLSPRALCQLMPVDCTVR